MVKNRSTIWKALDKEYQVYRREVCSKRNDEKMTAFIQYREKSSILFDCLKPNAIFEQAQAEFILDQRGPRQKCLMEYLLARDMTNIAVPQPDVEQMDIGDAGDVGNDVIDQEECEDEEEQTDEEETEDEETEEEGHLYFGLRSGKRVKASLEPEETGSDREEGTEDRIRIGPKLFSKQCVEAIIAMNSQLHITINQARSCFLLVENIFHGKCLRLNPENRRNVPRSAEDYKAYENVVPSEAVMWNWRHKYALCKLNLFSLWVSHPC